MNRPLIEAYPADHSGWDRLAAAVAEARRGLDAPADPTPAPCRYWAGFTVLAPGTLGPVLTTTGGQP